jgi:hypothetical protein
MDAHCRVGKLMPKELTSSKELGGFNAGVAGAWNYFTAGFVKCVR